MTRRKPRSAAVPGGAGPAKSSSAPGGASGRGAGAGLAPARPAGSRPAAVLLFLAALAIRLVHIAQISGTPLTQILLIDSETYDRLARLILSGGFRGEDVYSMNILYPWFLAAVYAVAGGPAAVLVVQAVLGALSVVMIHRLAGRLFGGGTALLAGAGAALYGPLVFYTGTLLTPTIIVFNGLAAITALDAWRDDPRAPTVAAAGAAIGLMALARGNNLLLAPLAIPFLVMHAPRGRAIRHAALLCAAALLPLVGVTVRNTLVEGQVVPVAANYAAFYVGHNEDATGLYVMPKFTGSAAFESEVWGTRDAIAEKLGRDVTLAESVRYLFEEGVRFALAHPLEEMKLLGRKFYYFWNRTESPTNLNYYFALEYAPLLRLLIPGFGWIAPLGMLGMVLAWRERRKHLLLHLFLAVPLVTCLLFFVSAEYRITAAPVLLIFGAAAITKTVAALRSPVQHRTLVTVLVMLPVAAVFTNVRTPLLRAQSLLRVDYLNFGTLYTMRGDLDTAAALLRRSLAIDPRYGPALAALADVERRRGNTNEAVRLLGEARRFQAGGSAAGETPAAADAAAQLDAATQYRNGNFAEALAGYRALRSAAPGDDPAYRASLDNNIGLCLYKLGDLAGADSLYRALIAGNPGYVKAYTNLGLVLDAAGRPEEAVALYRRALEIEPGNRSALRRLGASR